MKYFLYVTAKHLCLSGKNPSYPKNDCWLLMKCRVENLFINQDDCWSSLPSEVFKCNCEINYSILSWKNIFLPKEVSYTSRTSHLSHVTSSVVRFVWNQIYTILIERWRKLHWNFFLKKTILKIEIGMNNQKKFRSFANTRPDPARQRRCQRWYS